jgi:hypothetical protein
MIKRAADASKYVAVPATAPQLAVKGSEPAWVIQFVGEWPDAKTGESWIDHTCIFIGEDPVQYATGPRRDLRTGKIVRGYYQLQQPPSFSLPPLAP